MTTSNDYTFTLTKNQLIQRAMLMANVVGSEETLSAADYQIGSDFLNMLIKDWENDGLHIWERREAYLFLQPNQTSYQFDGGSIDNVTETYTQTSLVNSVATGGNTFSVSSAVSINVGDYIGVILATNQLFWSTVTSITGTTVVITGTFPSAANAGAIVYDYTTNITKPLSILGVRRRDSSSDNDIKIFNIPYLTYQNLPNKSTSPGYPIQVTYERGLTYGTLYVWPTPVDSTQLICFTYSRQIQNLDSATNTPDIPSEMYLSVVVNLAVLFDDIYGSLPQARRQVLEQRAALLKQLALSYDNEFTYVQASPSSAMSNN